MSKIDDLITTLVAGAAPVASARAPWQLLLSWVAITVLSIFGYIMIAMPRTDLALQLQSPLYLAELATLLTAILLSALAAIWLCYPDVRQKPIVIYLPIVPVILFALLLTYRAFHPELSAHLVSGEEGGLQCSICVTVLSLIPGFWMFRIIRQHATTHPHAAGAIALLTAASVGLFALRIAEMEDSVAHILGWHVIPVIVLGIIGAKLGKKLFAW